MHKNVFESVSDHVVIVREEGITKNELFSSDAKFDEELVSVIIPAYNSSRYISKSLKSAIEQTYKNLEIIIVDDGSTDDTARIIDEYAKVDQRIRYIYQKNAGVGAARNTGMGIATGKYIAFLDSDDIWSTNKIEKQIKLMKKERVFFCYTALDFIDEKGNIIKEHRHIRTSVDYRYLLKNTVIATSSVVLDRSQCGTPFMPKYRKGEDYATWLRLLRKYEVSVGIDEPLLHYRKTTDSLSSHKWKNVYDIWKVQVNQEHIHPLRVLINILFYITNAIKKHYF